MASEFTAGVDTNTLVIIRSGLGLLVNLLQPYRDRPVLTKKLFGFLSISITIGEVLDWLVQQFGPVAAAMTPPPPQSTTP